jgi:subtilisin family serine protease
MKPANIITLCLVSVLCGLAWNVYCGQNDYYSLISRVPYSGGEGYSRNTYEWHLVKNTGQADSLFLNGAFQESDDGGNYSLNVPTNRDASGVIIGVIDSGVNDTIADLSNSVIAGRYFNYPSFTNDDYSDNDGHGTEVASILVGNGTVIDGVATGAKLLVVDDSGYQDQNVAAGIEWCADNGANVICLAWGMDYLPDTNILEAACLYASNCVIVCAVIDDGVDYDTGYQDFPTSFGLPNVIAVTDVDSDGDVFNPGASGYGTNIIGAPGRIILCDSLSGTVEYATGTSYSCPLVAGCIALLIHNYPDQTPEFYINILKGDSSPCKTIYGKVDTSLLNFHPSISIGISQSGLLTAIGNSNWNFTVESSQDLRQWNDISKLNGGQSLHIAMTNSNFFYRLKF